MFILLSLVALGLALEPEYGVPPVLLPDPYVPEDTNYQPQNPGYPLNPGPPPPYGGRFSSDSWESSSEDCNDCDDVHHHCHHYNGGGYEQCVKPKFNYLHTERGRCRQVVISCPHDGHTWALETPHNHKLFKGKGFSLLAKCNRRGKWAARDLNGYKVDFNRVHCAHLHSPGYGVGGNLPSYPPLNPPSYSPDSQSNYAPPPPPIYSGNQLPVRPQY